MTGFSLSAAKANVLKLNENRAWKTRLSVMERGRKVIPISDIRNALISLNHCPALQGLFAYNEFVGRIELTRDSPWETEAAEICDEDVTSLADYLIRIANLNVPIPLLEKAVSVVAKENSFDPLKAWVIDLPFWDQTERLSNFFSYYFGAIGNQDYLAAVSRAFLISCIARACEPGCKVDTVPILEGQQGGGKSTAIRILAGDEWFLDDVGEPGSLVTQMKLQGRFIIELAELDALGRAEVTKMKEFLSRTEDSFRRPYEKFPVRLPRRCVFVGTTNESVYLKDRTGNRRFWPINCGKIDLNRLAEDREQLFAEASRAFNDGEAYYLSKDLEKLAGIEQEGRLLEESWLEPVCDFIDNKESVSIHEVLESLGVLNAQQNPMHTKRVAALLQSIHWKRKRTNKGNRWLRTEKAEPIKPKMKMKFKPRHSKQK